MEKFGVNTLQGILLFLVNTYVIIVGLVQGKSENIFRRIGLGITLLSEIVKIGRSWQIAKAELEDLSDDEVHYLSNLAVEKLGIEDTGLALSIVRKAIKLIADAIDLIDEIRQKNISRAIQ